MGKIKPFLKQNSYHSLMDNKNGHKTKREMMNKLLSRHLFLYPLTFYLVVSTFIYNISDRLLLY